ncbi:MAG TPA: endonuclease/exonuclease/phosphatase family protein [Candidatus Nanopelagicales bacterium]
MIRTARTLCVTALAAGALLATPMATSAAPAPAGAATPALAAPRADGPIPGAIRVGTFNIAKSTIGYRGFTWAVRRGALVNVVAAARPDVLAIQEANTQVWRGVRHIDDVVNLLGSVGYRIASTDVDACNPGCTRGAHIFFNPDRMSLATLPNPRMPAAGMTGQSNVAGTWLPGVQERAVSWAFLTPRGSTRTTLYVSVHMPTQQHGTGEALRVAIANRLLPWASELVARSALPQADLVIAGDFNSFDRRQPQGAQQVLRAAGLLDGWLAPEKVNANYSTVNTTPKTRKYKGFPPGPYFYKRDTTRIDYIFSTATPLRHEVFLRLTGDGKFDNAFRASDHNLVMVDLPLA